MWLIHQKIRLQSGERRLQSGGKSTYSNSRASIPESQHSPVAEATREPGPLQHWGGNISFGIAARAPSSKERWQPPADPLGSASFPGTMTPSTSSAWSVARSSIQKNFAIWKLKTRLEPRISPTIPKGLARGAFMRAARLRGLVPYLAPAPLAAGAPVRRDTSHA